MIWDKVKHFFMNILRLYAKRYRPGNTFTKAIRVENKTISSVVDNSIINDAFNSLLALEAKYEEQKA